MELSACAVITSLEEGGTVVKKKETFLSHAYAGSVCGQRTSRMLACKSAYMLAEGQKVDSVFGTLRCAYSQRCNSKINAVKQVPAVEIYDLLLSKQLAGNTT